MFKLLDVKTYLNKWSVQSDKRIWQNNVSLFINEYLSYKRKRFAFVGIICWISKFSPGKKQKLMWIWALVCSSWLKLFMIEVEKKNLCWYLIIYLMCVLIIIYIVIISCLRLKLFIFFQNVRLFLLKFFWKNMKWFSLDKCRLVRGIASLPMLKCVALLCQMLVRYFSNQYVSFLMWMVCT